MAVTKTHPIKSTLELLINGYEYNENERKSKDDENN